MRLFYGFVLQFCLCLFKYFTFIRLPSDALGIFFHSSSAVFALITECFSVLFLDILSRKTPVSIDQLAVATSVKTVKSVDRKVSDDEYTRREEMAIFCVYFARKISCNEMAVLFFLRVTSILVVYSLPHILGSHFSIRSQQLDRHVIFYRLYLPRDYRIVNVWFPGTR